LIWKNRMLFLLTGFSSVVISAVIAMLLPVYYQASSMIFPARTSSIILNESGVNRGNISDFGEVEEAEQLLQIMDSEVLKMMVIGKYDLFGHYGIDPKSKYARSKILQKYNSRIDIKRTKYNSIQISAIDHEPIMAADLANSIISFTDSVKNKMIRDRAEASLPMVEQEYLRLEKEIQEIMDTLHRFQDSGVVGEWERASLHEAYSVAINNLDRETAKKLEQRIAINGKYGDEFDILKRRRDINVDQFYRIRSLRNQFLNDSRLSIPQQFVVDYAMIPDKKSYPVRWLIVTGTTVGVLLIVLFLLVYKELIRSKIIDALGSD